MNLSKYKQGFTIVELLIVIVVIGILAAITIVAFNGVQTKAKQARVKSDVSNYTKAITIARNNTGKVLKDITGTTWSIGDCDVNSQNTANTEPKNLDKNHVCWSRYRDNLDKISTASGMNLDGLKAGDPNGNPYGLDENEGESCLADYMYTFNGNGTASYSQIASIPRTTTC